MTFQLIISTMYQQDHSLISKMNINSDAVIVNQCDRNSIETLHINNHTIIWINSDERGLSKSRNLALKYCSNDIILLVDDDEILYDNLSNLITSEFKLLNEPDLITFNIKSIDNVRLRYINLKNKKLGFKNIFRYGSARIAFSLDFINKNHIVFNEEFGAGTPNGGGEDSLFLNDFLKNKAKCFTSPIYIADIDDSKSTWFRGFDEKYFFNLGKFIFNLSKKHYKTLIFFISLKRIKCTKNIGYFRALKQMYKGAKIQK